jgi:hypothetical protein
MQPLIQKHPMRMPLAFLESGFRLNPMPSIAGTANAPSSCYLPLPCLSSCPSQPQTAPSYYRARYYDPVAGRFLSECAI